MADLCVFYVIEKHVCMLSLRDLFALVYLSGDCTCVLGQRSQRCQKVTHVTFDLAKP